MINPTAKKPARKVEANVNDKPAVSLQAKLKTIRDAVVNALVEREEDIDLMLTALLAQENLLCEGDPGTAKSLMLDTLSKAVVGAKNFPILLTKFTTPEEVFGPISVKGLKEDRYNRITTNRLPEAHTAFVDEIFKASSAILNTMLRILNERQFDNGDGTFRKCPLLLCVAASNEWPNSENGGKELNALFDRFLIRKRVKKVSRGGKRRLLRKAMDNDSCQATFTDPLTLAEVRQAHQEAMNLPWDKESQKGLWEIVEKLTAAGVDPSDRRLMKSVKVVRAYAYLQGAAEVTNEHLEVLAHVLWDDPAEQPDKCAAIVGEVANTIGGRAARCYAQAVDVDAKQLSVFEAATRQEDKDNACKFASTELKQIARELSPLDVARGGERLVKAKAFVDDALKAWGRRINNLEVE